MYSAKDAGTLKHIIEPYFSAGVLTSSDREWIEAKLQPLRDFIENSPLRGELFWIAFREKFFGFANPLVQDKKIPMNAANLCPELTPLLEVANLLRLRYNENVSQQQRMSKGIRVQQLEWARKQIAEGLGIIDIKPEDEDTISIAIVRNASEANNAVSRSFDGWNPNGTDNVVLWEENHPTNLAAWELRANKNNFEKPPEHDLGQPLGESSGAKDLFKIRKVTFAHNCSDENILKAFTDQIDNNTRFVSYSWISNSKGFRIPDRVIEGIWDYVQSNFPNCHIHVDGTMAWGARKVNLVEKPFCHSFVSSAHKWFLGPKETGILWMDQEKVKNFIPSIYAYNYKIAIPPKLPNSALRFELLGQRDDVNLITLGITQEMWLCLEKSDRNPYGRVKELNQFLVDQLKGLKTQTEGIPWNFITPTEESRRLGIIVIDITKVPSNPPEILYDWLYENKGIAGNGGETTFRLCPHIYNTEGDIEQAVTGIGEWLRLPRPIQPPAQ